VTVVGACSLSEGEQARSLPSARSVAVVPNGIDELSEGGGMLRDAAEDSARRVVAIGRPLPQRRPEACARILSGVSDVAEVRWLGGGREVSPGTRALLDAGITMTGWQPRDETLRTLARSAVYLHWTAWDGLPLSLLEAIALDVVVVASDIGPNREVLGPDQVCRTEAQAVALIRRLLEDVDLRQQFLRSQRERRAFYGADRMVRGWGDLYETLLRP
jgi:glycosyltransferase involved in cell wall biosynthesis